MAFALDKRVFMTVLLGMALLFPGVAAAMDSPTGALRPEGGARRNAGMPATLIELDGTISENPEGGSLEYEWVQTSGPTVELSDPTSPKPYFRTAEPGVYVFELVVSSDGLRSDPHIVQLEIECENLPPVAKIPAEFSGQVGKVLELDAGESFDPEGETLTYRWRPLSGGLDIPLSALSKQVLSFEPKREGVYELELIVSDGEKTSPPAVCRLAIRPRPKPPVARARVTALGQGGSSAAQPVIISAGPEVDDDSPAPLPSTTAPRGKQRTLPTVASPLTAPVSAPPLAIRPTAPADISAMMPPKAAALAPLPTMSPPQPGVPALSPSVPSAVAAVPASEPFPIPLPPAEPIIAEPLPEPIPVPTMPAMPAVPVGIPPSPPATAPLPMPSYITDTTGQKPVARIEAPGATTMDSVVMLDGRGSVGLGSGRLEFLWRQVSGPFVTEFERVFDGAAERFRPPEPGEYEFELVVVDNGIESDPYTHSIRITPGATPPVAVVLAPERAIPGALVRMDATRSYDPEGNPIVYRWRQTGGPAVKNYVIDESTGDAAPSFRPESEGIYSFELIVSNGKLNSKSVEIDILVGNAQLPPNVVLEGPEAARAGEDLTYRVLIENAPGRRFTFEWIQLEGPAGALQGVDGIQARVQPPQPGRYVLGVTAFENGVEAGKAVRVLEVFRPESGRSGTPIRFVEPLPEYAEVRGGSARGAGRVPTISPLPNSAPLPDLPAAAGPGARTVGSKRGSPAAQVLQNSRGK